MLAYACVCLHALFRSPVQNSLFRAHRVAYVEGSASRGGIRTCSSYVSPTAPVQQELASHTHAVQVAAVGP
eukprot:7399620-Alexandrium_andersonii.AAC.1